MTWLNDIRSLMFLDMRHMQRRIEQCRRPVVRLLVCGIVAAIGVYVVASSVYGLRNINDWPISASVVANEQSWGQIANLFGGLYGVMTITLATYAATRRSPVSFNEGDIQFVFASPISPRVLISYRLTLQLFVRSVVLIPLIFGLAKTANLYGASLGARSSMALWIFMIGVQAWALIISTGVWLVIQRGGADRIVVSPTAVRTAIVTIITGMALWVLHPTTVGLMDSAQATVVWADVWLEIMARCRTLANVPLWSSWLKVATRAASMRWYDGLGPSLMSFAAAGVALGSMLRFADDYYEPAASGISMAAEQAHRVAEGTHIDMTGAVVSLQGRTARPIRLPAFGRGPWALAWAQAVRHVRMQVALIPVMLAAVGGFGVVLGALVRFGAVSPLGVLLFQGGLALMGGGAYIDEELRRPYVFMVPGGKWQHLCALSVVSVADQMLTHALMLGVACIVGDMSWLFYVGSGAFLTALILVGQGGAMASAVICQPGSGRPVRLMAQLILIVFALGPAAIGVSLLVMTGKGMFAIAVAAMAALLISAVGLLQIAVAAFHRVDMV